VSCFEKEYLMNLSAETWNVVIKGFTLALAAVNLMAFAAVAVFMTIIIYYGFTLAAAINSSF